MQQMKDLKSLLAQQGVQDTALISSFKDMFKWNSIISKVNTVDILEKEVSNPMDTHVDKKDCIF